MPVVCKTYNRRGNTPPAAYARAHDLGLIPLVRPRGAQHDVGHAKLLRRWALDFLVLPLLPVCRCPLSCSCRTCPGAAPGGGRRARGWLGLGLPGPLPPSGAPSCGPICASSATKSCLGPGPGQEPGARSQELSPPRGRTSRHPWSAFIGIYFQSAERHFRHLLVP